MGDELQYSQQYFSDFNTRLRDIEEKQRLLKDRILLIGQNLIEEREKNFNELQELKKITIQLKDENIRIRELVHRISEQVSEFARKEELMILQRQLDIIKPNIK